MRKRISLNQGWMLHQDGNNDTLISIPFSIRGNDVLSRKTDDLRMEENRSYLLQIRCRGSFSLYKNGEEIYQGEEALIPLNGIKTNDVLSLHSDDLSIRSITWIETEKEYISIKSIKTYMNKEETGIQSEIDVPTGYTVRYCLSLKKEKITGEYQEDLKFSSLSQWSGDDPVLYDFTLSSEKDGLTTDTISYKIGFCSDNGLNHNFFGLHYQCYLKGKESALSKDDIESDIHKIKESGFDFIIGDYDETVLSFCDQYGLSVLSHAESNHPCMIRTPDNLKEYSFQEYSKHRIFHKKDDVIIKMGKEDIYDYQKMFSLNDPHLSYVLLPDYELLFGEDRKQETDTLRIIKAYLSEKKFTYILDKEQKHRKGKKLIVDVISNEPILTIFVNNMELATLGSKALFRFTLPAFKVNNVQVKGKESKDKAVFLSDFQ